MILLNGIEAETLPLTDRAIHYGDGCFSTILVKQQSACLLDHHLARLKRDANQLLIKTVCWDSVAEWVALVSQSIETDKGVVKVMLSRGSGGRGYSPQGCSEPNVIILSYPYPMHYRQWQQNGIVIAKLDQSIHHSNLAGVKHMNRLEQVLFKQEVEEKELDDGLVCDVHGHVIETSSANIFWRKGNEIFTPDLSMCGVNGVMRQVVKSLCPILGYQFTEVLQGVESPHQADEIFMTNAVLEIAPVRQFEQRELNNFDASNALLSELAKW